MDLPAWLPAQPGKTTSLQQAHAATVADIQRGQALPKKGAAGKRTRAQAGLEGVQELVSLPDKRPYKKRGAAAAARGDRPRGDDGGDDDGDGDGDEDDEATGAEPEASPPPDASDGGPDGAPAAPTESEAADVGAAGPEPAGDGDGAAVPADSRESDRDT